MASCKLEDIPYLLNELCRSFDDDALQKLVRLAAKIETDDNLKKTISRCFNKNISVNFPRY